MPLWTLGTVHNSRRPLDRLFVFLTVDIRSIDLISIDRREIVVSYPFAKIGDFSFSRFSIIVRTDRHTQT